MDNKLCTACLNKPAVHECNAKYMYCNSCQEFATCDICDKISCAWCSDKYAKMIDRNNTVTLVLLCEKCNIGDELEKHPDWDVLDVVKEAKRIYLG